jgi:hemin uptake protein HemP
MPHRPTLPAQSAAPRPPHSAPVVPSAQLLGTHQSIEIDHNGQRYRLQSTRSGKLILTK